MMENKQQYYQISQKTVSNLKSIAHSLALSELSQLSLPEIDAVADQIGRVVPAGNVPGVILNGLARLPERTPSLKNVRRDINLLFKGARQALDKTTYYTFFAGPAAAIWGYQNLLKLAGKDPEDSFPEGTWQFYVDYAMREDTARHVNETHGFDTDLKRYKIHLSKIDRITAWVMAAGQCIHQYNGLLENEWRERVYTYLLTKLTREEPDSAGYARLYHTWAKQLPYRREADAGSNEPYPAYRRRKFDEFLQQATAKLSPALRQQWQTQSRAAEAERLPIYQQQMSILAYLNPAVDGETRTPIDLQQAHIAVIHQGEYHLIPVCAPNSRQITDIDTVRGQIAALLNASVSTQVSSLVQLAKMQRANWPELRKQLNPTLLKNLDNLRHAPIIFNCDQRPRNLPLAEVRQTERGVGSHALTLFDTGETIVMDQSHIFFDGAWGAAVAEILANEAISWAVYLNTLPPVQLEQHRPQSLAFSFEAAELAWLQKVPQVTPEVSVETDIVNVKIILRLRRLFKRRNDLIQLTVNDLLVLYRAIHAIKYQANPDIIAELQELTHHSATQKVAANTLKEIEDSQRVNPALVIPVDGSRRNPRDRLYPITFEAPLKELDFINLHQQCVAALESYKSGQGDRSDDYTNFDKLQRNYLASLAGFGAVLSRAKEIAIAGESASVGAIKMLAHMPTPLQRMLDQIPGRIDLLNDLIKGREVFSNVGAVAPTSTLTRFITAKDDNDKKDLAWGVMTDAQGIMRITLRDFRPHIRSLLAVKQKDLATCIVQDYLDTYANGLNTYIKELRRITETSRETRLAKLEELNE